ncbi:MAG: ShlB/FhaC/HecB family hemolysin secretion/activation protein [Collimonas sp.]
MQQIPPTPIPQHAAPKVEVRQGSTPDIPESDSVKIVVKSLKVTGAQAYSEADLLAVTGFKPGSELTLSDLRGMAAKIADYYHRNGYFVTQAYLPAQDIKDGVVTIAVIDGQYGKVTLRNQTNLSDNLANSLLGGLNSGDPVTSAPLESRLLLLSDLPGVKVKSTLVPGASVGASDLIVDLTPGQRVTGSIDADNAGNRYTGEYRVGATVNLNDPTGHGDIASLRALTSGSGLNYARASYQMQFGKATAGVAYSHLEYKLGREFESLKANGTANIASIYGSYPLIRSRNNNLYAGLAFDAKTFQDKVDSTSTVADKKAHVLMASLYGDHRDNFGGGGLSGYSVTWSVGNINLQTPAVQSFDAATAQSNGHFNKLAFSATRLQSVTDTISLYASINGQVASKNLDVSEKMELGGMYGVRAYPEGEAYADQGYVMNLEARMQLPKFSEKLPGQMQLIGFVDTGTVTVNKNPWVAGTNRRTLSGAGVGLNWTDANNFAVRAYYAHKLGSDAATSAPDRSGRFWIQAVKYF